MKIDWLVSRLNGIDEEKMYHAPATTVAVISMAAKELARLDAESKLLAKRYEALKRGVIHAIAWHDDQSSRVDEYRAALNETDDI